MANGKNWVMLISREYKGPSNGFGHEILKLRARILISCFKI